MSIPILLTGTIDVSNSSGGVNYVVINNTLERLKQYESAIEKYIKLSSFDRIVFVETSNYKFDESRFSSLASSYNKRFEYITFQGDYEKVKEKGKSYGEAEAILYGIKNSKLLENEETIYKGTGRIFLRNSKKIVKHKDKIRNEFISFSKIDYGRCVTWLFKFNKSDYLKYFADCQYQCNESIGKDIEKVFFEIIVDNNIEQKPFNQYPRMNGIIGGLGIKYDKSFLKYKIFDILLKTGFFTVKKKKS